MTCVFDDQPHIVVSCKFDPGSNISCRCRLDTVHGIVAQVALWISSQSGIDRGAAFHEWIAISNGKFCQVLIACPVGADTLTELGAVSRALVARFSNWLVARQLSVNGAV